MQPDINTSIAALLYEHNRLSIPGWGSFELAYQPASINQIQGQIEPPAKALSFNSDLQLDDGLLAQYLQRHYELGALSAREAINQYVQGLKTALDRREIVEIQHIGRFYRDYEQQVRFIAESHNFNKESFGLAAVAASPTSRTTVSSPGAAAQPGKRPVAPDRPKAKPGDGIISGNISGWFQRNLYWIGILSVVIVALGAYLLFLQPSPQEDLISQLPQDRINVSPTDNIEGEEQGATTTDETREDTADPEDTEAPTLAPGQQYAVIAVGLFGDERNVQRLVERIYRAGYEPYTSPENKLTRVGVQVTYESEAHLLRILRDVRSSLEENAFVLEKNGERVRSQ